MDLNEIVDKIYNETKDIKDGKVADYIPHLANVNPELYAISYCDIKGKMHSVGDYNNDFCLQSCSKPLNYCLARMLHTDDGSTDDGSTINGLTVDGSIKKEHVHNHVGYEPSGREFNSFVLNRDGLPHNPLINAGAIMVSSLIESDKEPSKRFEVVQKFYEKISGNIGKIGFNNGIYLSEKHHADRNISLAYYMRENNAYQNYPTPSQLESHLDLYYQCCSVTVNCEIGAIIASTLANNGTCPITSESVIESDIVKDTLSIMYTCGMYDFSGQFAFKNGLPAKSGVSGCLLLVIPNVGGFCIWSPRLDIMGNSVRGVKFCELFTKYTQSQYHIFTGVHQKDKDSEYLFSEDTIIQKIIHIASTGNKKSLEECIQKIKQKYKEDDSDENVEIHVKSILDKGDYDGRTALHLACAEGHLEIVNLLLEYDVDDYPKDRWGNTPYHEAWKIVNDKETENNNPNYNKICELLKSKKNCEHL